MPLPPTLPLQVLKSNALLTMYANRCNSHWAEGQVWSFPRVWERGEQDRWSDMGQAKLYRQSAVELLARGAVAFHYMAESDSLPVTQGTRVQVGRPWQGMRVQVGRTGHSTTRLDSLPVTQGTRVQVGRPARVQVGRTGQQHHTPQHLAACVHK